MSEYEYKKGVEDANRGWQPSPPNPNQTWEQNNAYQKGWKDTNDKRNEKPSGT